MPEQHIKASKFMSCYLSQFKNDAGEPCVSAQEINPLTYL